MEKVGVILPSKEMINYTVIAYDKNDSGYLIDVKPNDEVLSTDNVVDYCSSNSKDKDINISFAIDSLCQKGWVVNPYSWYEDKIRLLSPDDDIKEPKINYSNISDFNVKFSEPEHGWLNLNINEVIIHCSYVFDPLFLLKDVYNKIMVNKTAFINIDEEGKDKIIFLFNKGENIRVIIDNHNKKRLLDILVKKNDFYNSFQNAYTDLCCKLSEHGEHWVETYYETVEGYIAELQKTNER